MIELECSNCGRAQQLQDEFAGCVCRCRFCKAIQTVPGSAGAGSGQKRRWGRRGPKLLHCPDRSRAASSTSIRRKLVIGVALAALVAGGATAAVVWVNADSSSPRGSGAAAQ